MYGYDVNEVLKKNEIQGPCVMGLCSKAGPTWPCCENAYLREKKNSLQ